MSKKNKLILGVILVIIVVVGIIIISFNSQSSNVEQLSDDVFSIQSASWNSFVMHWEGNSIVADTTQPINYDIRCNYCKTGLFNGQQTNVAENERCIGTYHLVVDSKESMVYNVAIDGINTPNLRNTQGSMSSFGYNVGVNNIAPLVNVGSVVHNLDMRNSHEITICATDSLTREKGFVCKSITLSAKC